MRDHASPPFQTFSFVLFYLLLFVSLFLHLNSRIFFSTFRTKRAQFLFFFCYLSSVLNKTLIQVNFIRSLAVARIFSQSVAILPEAPR